MDVRAILLLATMVAGSASAQQVHKCIEGGKTTYQSAPCPNGAPRKSWDATPQPETYANQARLERIRQQNRIRAQGRSYQAPARSGGSGAVVMRSPSRSWHMHQCSLCPWNLGEATAMPAGGGSALRSTGQCLT